MALILVCAWPARQAADTHVPLTTLEYQILGTQLRIQPPVVNVPKGIAGSILPRVGTADGQTQGVDAELLVGTYVEALLRGPAFPSRRLVGRPNEPLLLPPLSLVGDYQLDGIRLVDAASGATRLEGLPSSVPVRVFDEVLISKVTSRPLSLQEIQAKGIVVDGLNFRAVEFEVGFVLDGQTIPIRFPVIAPDYGQAREIIPAAEQYRRLVAAQEINNRIAQEFMNGPDLPAELETRSLNLVIKGVNFERVDDEGGPDLRLAIPPIPALVVIPGNIGYLHQFFSVQVFTENGAPLGSGLTVFNARARVELPPGPDGILSTNYAQPGDDPLRLARVGPEQRQYSDLPIVRREPTPLERFGPGEGGQAEFLVEGLQEGLHTMDFDLSANLDGLAAGTVKVRGRASGSVLVRNPKFSLAFAHPKTVQAGEPYEAHVTLLNTGDVPANLLSITLRAASISGGRLETPETVQLGSLEPGQSATAAFRVRAQRSGAVSFSNLTTGEDSVQGRFNLRMGIDERGVELSPDSLALPGNVNALPAPVIAAAQRVLGQALSAATAGRLPAGVKSVSRAMITRRALELAEAGQRLQYGDSLPRVLADLLLDWQGGRAFQDGFDQIMIGTDAGREFREAIAKAAESAETVPAVARLIDRAPDLAGRGEAWTVMASSDPRLEPVLSSGSAMATLDQGSIPQTGGYRGTHGHWLVTRAGAGIARWVVKEGIDTAEVAALRLTATGTGELWRWSVGSLPAGACLSTDLDGEGTLLIDQACDGTGEGTVSGTRSTIRELPPSLVTAQQDTGLVLLRPQFRCSPGPANNYGHVLAVLFSKPMLQTNVEQPSAYTLDDGNVASGVRIQPGGRVALLSMQQPFSALRPRVLTVADIADARGNRLVSQSLSVQSEFRDGVAMNGKVLRADGSPAASVPVTVTMYEAWKDPFDRCDPIVESRVYQQLTDSEGNFTVDFVLGGAAYTVSAVDTGGLPLDVVMAALANAPGGVFEREKLLAAAVATNLFQAMGATSVDEGIALAEGLDRAVWRDHIDYYGGRMGKEIVVALKFRGRGTVAGRVLADAGGTPVARAAVNLYPDPESRELGRGVLTDSEGRFQFNGVPLGGYTVQVRSPQKHFRTVVGQLREVNERQTLEIVLTAPETEEIVRGGLRGRVIEPTDGQPHAGARLSVNHLGRFGVVAVLESDTDGFFAATDIPVGDYVLKAVSRDGRRSAVSAAVPVSVGNEPFINLVFNGTATVHGIVETTAGVRIANALVAGGETLVRSDAEGRFTLTGVPIGRRVISAGLEAAQAPGGFPRLGSTSLEVLPGDDNSVVVRLAPRGQISGIVLNARGEPVPKVNVAVPAPDAGGFAWVKADDSGHFRFINLAPGDYVVSAPAPPVQEKEGEEALGSDGEIDDETAQQILTALRLSVSNYLRRLDPSAADRFTPGAWGYTSARVQFDGDEAVVTVRYLPTGSVNGTVYNHQGVPIGARVRLTGVGPDVYGAPSMVIVGTSNSDPSTGEFRFGGLNQGDWGVQAASPFYAVVLKQSGRTTPFDLNVSNLVFQFPPLREFAGRLIGRVLLPDGTSAGAGVELAINVSNDYRLLTDTNGVFDTQIQIREGTYRVQAFDPGTGLKAEAMAQVKAGQTNSVDVTLLGKGGASVRVLRADGSPATDAELTIDQGTYPQEHYSGRADADGRLELDNLFAGTYSAQAVYRSGVTSLNGRTRFEVRVGDVTQATITLGPTGNVRGRFLSRGDASPIAFARVALGTLAFAPTDADGWFEFAGIALGSHRIIATDPVTGRSGVTDATLVRDGETVEVLVIEAPQGEIRGQVSQAGKGVVAGATVALDIQNGISPRRSVTTGPDGEFSFVGATPGPFVLTAGYTPPGGRGLSARATGTFPNTPATLEVNLVFPPPEVLGSLAVIVQDPSGAPAPNTRVTVGGLTLDTGAEGRVHVDGLALRDYVIRARSLQPDRTSSMAGGRVILSATNTNAVVTLTLSGVGVLQGRLRSSDRATPIADAEVTVDSHSDLDAGILAVRFSTFTAGDGTFVVSNLPPVAVSVFARKAALAATDTATITRDRTTSIELLLGPSGEVSGRLVRADGTNAVAGNEVLVKFKAPSGLDGVARATTGSEGAFRLSGIPVGAFTLEASRPAVNGIARREGFVFNDGQAVDLGAVRLDEDWPWLVESDPPAGATGVPILQPVRLTFSEALAANRIDPLGIYLRSPTNEIASTVQLLADPQGVPRIVQITPKNPLRSLTTYQVIVVDQDRKDATGRVIGQGPTDLVGRPLLLPYLGSFTTRDDDPPRLVSLYPTNGAVQVTPDGVIRASFSEPVQSDSLRITVQGPAGPIAGRVDLGLNGLVATFTPSQPLPLNAAVSFVLDGVQDLAANPLPGQPITGSFATLDTLGPTVTLRLGEDRQPIARATVPIEATVPANDADATVRFTQDLAYLGLATRAPYRVNATLPATGRTVFRAIATDRFGNDGPVAELAVDVLPNEAPQLVLSLVEPTNGVAQTGGTIKVELAATDDIGVTNLTLQAAGVLEFNRTFPNGTLTNVVIPIPASAPPGALSLTAYAVDALGERSADTTLVVPVRDATRPAIAWISPEPLARIVPGEPFEIVIATTENSTNTALSLTLGGALQWSRTNLVNAPAGATVTNRFLVPTTDAAWNGGTVSAVIVAADAAGNSLTVGRDFVLADVEPPHLVSVVPADGAIRQGLWRRSLVYTANEDLAASSISLDRFEVTASDGSTPAIDVKAEPRRFTLGFGSPLHPGVTYSNLLRPGITDRATNALRDLQTNAIPAEGWLTRFTTADVRNVTPTNGTPVLGGDLVPVEVQFDAELGAKFFRFTLNDSSPTVVAVAAGATNAVAQLLMPLGTSNLVVNLAASDNAAFTEALALGPITLKYLGDRATNNAPVVQLTRSHPAAGPVAVGDRFSLLLRATSPNVITNLELKATGALSLTRQFPNGGPFALNFTIPTSTVPGTPVDFAATAWDGLGFTSAVARLTIETVAAPEPPEFALNTVFYSRGDGTEGSVWRVGIDGTDDLRIAEGAWPRLSPDASRLAFHFERAANSADPARANLWVLDFASGSSRPVLRHNDSLVWFDWLVNSEQLVYDLGCQLGSIRIDGTDSRRLRQTDCRDDAPSVNPVDGRIVWQNFQDRGLWVAQADGSGAAAIPNTQPGDAWPVWSPDGQWISFLRGRNLWKIRPDGTASGALSGLGTADGSFQGPAPWLAAGGQVVVAGTVQGTNGLFAVATDGSGGMVQIPTTPGAPIEFVGSVFTGRRTPPTAPRLLGTQPAPGAVRQSLWTQPVYTSSLPLDPKTVNATTVVVMASDGLPVAYEPRIDDATLRVGLAEPLRPDVTYTNIIRPGVRGTNGAALTDRFGNALPADGLTQTFRTARFDRVTPTNGTPVIAGQTVPVRFEFEAGLARYFRVQLNQETPVILNVGPADGAAALDLPIPVSASSAVLSLAASDDLAFTRPWVLPPVTLALTPLGTDLVIHAPGPIEIAQSGTTNLVLEATSSSAPVTRLAVRPQGVPADFVWPGPVQYSNQATSGRATTTVAVNPLFAEPGTYELDVLAATASGATASQVIAITVTEDLAVPVTQWKAPASGNWSDASKWTAGPPGPSLPARIDRPGDYTVTLDVDAVVGGVYVGAATGRAMLDLNRRSLTVTGPAVVGANGWLRLQGRLAGAGDLAVRGRMEWVGGELSGGGTAAVLPPGLINATGTDAKTLGRLLRNHGTVTWSGGRLVSTAGVMENYGGWDVLSEWQVDGGEFWNFGTLRKTASTDAIVFRAGAGGTGRFVNEGEISVETGLLQLSRPSSVAGGSINLAADARLRIDGASFELGPAGSVGGQGRVEFAGSGRHAVNGAWTPGSTAIEASTVAFNRTARRLANLTLGNGALAGDAPVTLEGVNRWTDGRIENTALVELDPAATLQIEGTGSKTLNSLLRTRGEVSWTEGRIFAQGGIVENLGDWTVTGSLAIFNDGVFRNPGVVRYVKGDGTFIVQNSSESAQQFINEGELHLEAGLVRVSSHFASQTGTVFLGSDTRLDLAGSSSFGLASQVAGQGTVTISRGTHSVAGEWAPSLTSVASGRLNFDGPAALITDLVVSGGAVGGAAQSTLIGQMNWQGGTLDFSQPMVVAPGARLTATGTDAKTLGTTLENHGQVDWQAGTLFAFGQRAVNGADGVWRFSGNATYLDLQFVNHGSVVQSANGVVEVRNNNTGSARVVNEANVELNAGTCRVSCEGRTTGGWNLGAGSSLTVNANHEFTLESAILGPGRVEFASGNASVAGQFAPGTWAVPASGRVRFAPGADLALPASIAVFGSVELSTGRAQTLREVTLDGSGTLIGSDALTIAGHLEWIGGTLGGPGSVTLAPAASLTATSTKTKSLTGDLENFGRVDWELGLLFTWGHAIVNRPSGVWRLLGDAEILDAAFRNEGRLERSIGTGTVHLRNNNTGAARLDNIGSVRVDSGTLRLTCPGEGAGSWDINSTLQLAGNHTFLPGSVLRGPGRVELNAAAIVRGGFAPLRFSVGRSGQVQFAAGAQLEVKSPVAIEGSLSLHTGTAQSLGEVQLSGTLNGSDPITVTGRLDWTGGALGGAGGVTIAPGAVLRAPTSGPKSLGGPLENRGTVQWEQGLLFAFGQPVTNRAGARWSVGGDLEYLDAVWVNEGEFEKLGAGATRFRNNNTGLGSFRNLGQARLKEGTLTLSHPSWHNGPWQLDASTTLALDNQPHEFGPGVAFSGTGTLRVQSLLRLAAPVDFNTLTVLFAAGAVVQGDFPVANQAGGTIRVLQSLAFPGDVTIGGRLEVASKDVTLTVRRTLTLLSTGEINNGGALRAGAWVNSGGKYEGDPPVVIGLPSEGGFRIQQIRLVGRVDGATPTAASNEPSEVELRWEAEAGGRFAIEVSEDLARWTALGSPVEVQRAGAATVLFAIDRPHGFFRVVRVDPANSE